LTDKNHDSSLSAATNSERITRKIC